MPLSCFCDFDDPEYWYTPPDDYSELETSRRKRCASCDVLINIGDVVIAFERWRNPLTEIEERIHGGDDAEILLATMYHCERCADLFFSLRELGFECVSPDESMPDLVKQYAETYGRQPTKQHPRDSHDNPTN